jgi:hypothetical protein
MGKSMGFAGRKINESESCNDRGIIVTAFGGRGQSDSEFDLDCQLGIFDFADIVCSFKGHRHGRMNDGKGHR